MASPIDDLRAAGFSDAEIGSWSAERRQSLTDAGFKENEIDAYFVGGPTVPDEVPPAFQRRMEEGALARWREGNIIQSVPAFIDLMKSPDGRSKVWDAISKYPGEFVKGTIDTIKTPGDASRGLVDLSTPEGMDRAIGLGALVGLGRFSKIDKTGKTSGIGLTQGEQVARVERSPTGEIVDVPVGGLPKSEDFVAARQALSGETVPAEIVQDKLARLYKDHGIHPAEVVRDAEFDVTISQDLLSKSPDLPQRFVKAYHGSPYDFDKFDSSKIGTGEGAQAFGHGFYFAENAGVAKSYQQTLAGQQAAITRNKFPGGIDPAYEASAADLLKNNYTPAAALDVLRGVYKNAREGELEAALNSVTAGTKGRLYEVAIKSDPEQFLDWDKPLSEQPHIREAINKIAPEIAAEDIPGQLAYYRLAKKLTGQETLRSPEASEALRNVGVPGLKYLDEGSRGEKYWVARHPEGGTWEYPSEALARDFIARNPEYKLEPPNLTRNLVIFDERLIEITHKDGTPVTPKERADYLADANPEQTKTSVPSVGGDGRKPPMPPERPPGGAEPPQSPRDQILSKIDVGGKDPTTKITLDKLYTQAVDDLHPIRSVSDEAYQAARLTRGQFGKAQQFLEHGTFDFKTYENNGPSLRKIMEPVRDDFDGFRAYLAAKRALEIEESGRTSGMNLEAAKQVVKEGAEKLEAVAKDLGQFQANVLKYLKDSGVLSREAFNAMQAANKAYIPFYRIIADEAGGPKAGKSFGPSNPIKKLKGSERDIVDPLESIIKNTYAYISIAERNAVGQKIIDALKRKGAEDVGTVKKPSLAHDAEIKGYLEEHGVKSPPQDLVDLIKSAGKFEEGDTISAWRNGQKESVKINDPELLTAFRNLDAKNVDLVTKVLAVPTRTLRAGAVLSPDFIARNVIRDFLTAFVNTKGGVFTPLDTIGGLKSVIAKDADFQNWLKSGGANATLIALDRRYLQESLQKLNADTGLMSRSWNVVAHPIQTLRLVSELAENATRVAEFKKVAKDATSREALDKAAFTSREVTLDFARIGASMRAVNMITAFFNAKVQGLDRTIRAFTDSPATTTLKVAGGITVPSVLLWYANHEDPRYKELPQWQKDLFWIVLTEDTIYRIPKPFELGVIFGSGVERVLESTVGQNKEAFSHFGKTLWDIIAFDVTPTAAIPIVEQFSNRSTFRDRTLIPADVEKQLPEYQYTPYTTELTKKLGQVIAAFPGVRDASLEQNFAGGVARALTSPILVENYVRAWSGGLGTYALQGADAALRKTGILPDPIMPASTLADTPFVKAFVVRYPSASAQSIQDFYDDYDKSKKFFDTWMAKAQEGDVAATDRILEAGSPRIFAQLDGIKDTLTEHSKLIRDITKNPEIKPEEKRQLIDTLYYSMIEVGKAGKDMMKQINEASRAPGQ